MDYVTEILHSAQKEIEAAGIEGWGNAIQCGIEEIERLRQVCSWAAGRLLDAGDVWGHEQTLELRGETSDE